MELELELNITIRNYYAVAKIIGRSDELVARICVLMEDNEDVRYLLTAAVEAFKDIQKDENKSHYEGINQN